MTAINDFRTVIREYIAHEEYSDVLVDSFIRQAESNLSRQMRVKEMIVIADAPVTESRVALPVGWRELEYVRREGGKPLTYVQRDSLFGGQLPQNHYTVVGDYILFGNTIDGIDGTDIELAYFASAPHLAAGENWLYRFYYDIFLHSAVAAGLMYALEQERAAATLSMVQGLVGTANEEYLVSKISGSTLRRPNNRARLG